MNRPILILLLVVNSLVCFAQHQINFSGINGSILKEVKAQSTVRDSLFCLRELNRIERELVARGYLTANIDSIQFQGKQVHVLFTVGKSYKWATISKGNVEEEALIQSGYRNKILDGKKITSASIAKLHNSIITHYENNGYPFVSSQLNQLKYIDSTRLKASLDVRKGPMIKIDSIILLGSAKISKTYIANYIGIKEGDVYDQSKLSLIDNRIKELSFVTSFKPSQVGFSKKDTKLYLFLNHKGASKFNGILGVLPDNNTGKINITGDAKIALKNAFKKGEAISLNWRKLQSLTQDLDIKLNYPFLFQTTLGVDAQLKLFKKDTSYLELNQRLGLQYLFSGGNYIMVFFDNYSSNLINSKKYASSTVLPDFADITFRQYGISILQSKLDYRINPRKGYDLFFIGSAGNKTINKNPELNENLYQNLDLHSLQFKLQTTLGYFFPLAKRSTIYTKINAGYLVNDNLFFNELFRIGGLRTLRGFDEENINASLFGIITLEYRFLLEQNSNIYVFGDYAYYERTIQDEHASGQPYGFGAGISFQTKPGIFSLGYALGTQQGNLIQFKTAKVHFGFINYF
ncbi:MAG: BamA/TamA family outer membrane protein [Flavobacteriales bacterium]|nr:BamA/TamA family outer membrane protein [Flavobacteriales bacterium]